VEERFGDKRAPERFVAFCRESCDNMHREDAKDVESEDAMSTANQLRERLRSNALCGGVVGLGYAGLPLVTALGSRGIRVVGYDVNAVRVEQLSRGVSYVSDVPSDALAELLRKNLFHASTDAHRLVEADAISICVPTPLSKTKEPDLSFVVSATREIAKGLRPGQLIVLESTTYPGTTQELVLPILEESGLRVGVDFFLAYSPERIDPGNRVYRIENTPKIIGGITPTCAALAALFYSRFLERTVQVSSTSAAEMVKLLENTFRSVNIALANEMSLLCDRLGLDVWEIIDAAATKPFGFMPFYPGPGLGGHCIPVDPHYLAWRARELQFNARFIQLATEINASMPRYVVTKVGEALNERKRPVNGSRALVLGVAYKENVDDVRESPAFDVMSLLIQQGAEIVYHDPFVPKIVVEGKFLESYPLWESLLPTVDVVVILTAHDGLNYARLRHADCPVVDMRGILRRVRS
jgi:UDP-N-acetyl-D-glucosamine dehydrogenase